MYNDIDVLGREIPSTLPKYKEEDHQSQSYTELGMLRNPRWGSWPADTLYIWTNDEAFPQLRQRIEERWEASEIVEILPDVDEEMRFANLDDEHDLHNLACLPALF